MAFERVVLSKEGRGDINRIISFVRSLVIKIEDESRDYETKETVKNWMKYKTSIEGSSDFFTYNYTINDLKNYGYTDLEIENHNLTDPMQLQILFNKKSNKAINFLKYLRETFIKTYVEYNNYYCQFLGQPLNESEILFYENKDVNNMTSPYYGHRYIPVHVVTFKDTPISYEFLFIQREIDKYLEKYPDFTYLKFLQEPLDIYKVREAENFDILYYKKNILTLTETNIFFKSYNNAQNYCLQINWKEGFSWKYPAYVYLQEYLILMKTFQSFFNLQLDRYTLCQYTDQEIFDILDSYNLSALKQIDIKILRKIILNLPELIEIRGSDAVIFKLLDYIEDEEITIKRYHLQKRFPIDSNELIKFNEDKMYEDSVSLVFKEDIIKSSADIMLEKEKDASTSEVIYDYHDWTESDPLWGGDGRGLTEEQKYNLRETLRRELLKQDFTSIYTKYMTLSTISDIKEKRANEIHKFNLLLHRAIDRNNFLIDDSIAFKGESINPITLYAVMCLFQGILKSVKDPHLIRGNNVFATFIRTMNVADILSLETELRNTNVFIPSKNKNVTLESILGKDFNYIDYIIRHSIADDTLDILDEYENDRLLLETIKDNIFNESDFEIYSAWETIYYFNIHKKYVSDLFVDSLSYFDIIEMYSPVLANSLRTSLFMFTGHESDTVSEETMKIRVNYALSEVPEYYHEFNKYIREISGDRINLCGLSETETYIAYMNDLMILFNEFLSVYTTLYKSEFIETIRDKPYNKFRMLYEYINDHFEDDSVEKFGFNYKTFSKISDIGKDLFFGLTHYHSLSTSYDKYLLNWFELIKYVNIDNCKIDKQDINFSNENNLVIIDEVSVDSHTDEFIVKHLIEERSLYFKEFFNEFFGVKDVGTESQILDNFEKFICEYRSNNDKVKNGQIEHFGIKHFITDNVYDLDE